VCGLICRSQHRRSHGQSEEKGSARARQNTREEINEASAASGVSSETLTSSAPPQRKERAARSGGLFCGDRMNSIDLAFPPTRTPVRTRVAHAWISAEVYARLEREAALRHCHPDQLAAAIVDSVLTLGYLDAVLDT
jgi:hypothetical protein